LYVKDVTRPLDAAYAVPFAYPPILPAFDDMFTIREYLLFFRKGKQLCTTKNVISSLHQLLGPKFLRLILLGLLFQYTGTIY
jgi:hypothetical protein